MGRFETALRRFIEDRLPWFHPLEERLHNARTEAIRQRSIRARIRAERVIAEYRAASSSAADAGDRLVKEARRDR